MICVIFGHSKQFHQAGVGLWCSVASVPAAAGVTDVEFDAPIGDHFVGVAELGVQAALGGQDVEGAKATPGGGAALMGQTLAGEVCAGFAFELQGTEVTRKAAHSESREEQSRKQKGRGQLPATGGQMNVHSDGRMDRGKQ